MNPPRDSLSPPAGPGARPSRGHAPAPRVDELASQLLLPGLFRAGAVAARPDRIVAGFLTLLLVMVAAASLNGEAGETGPFGLAVYNADLATSGIVSDLIGLNPGGLADRARMLLIETPAMLMDEAPFATLVLLVVGAIAWALPGLYICRGAGMELGRHLVLSVRRSVRFVATKCVSAVLSVLLAPITASIVLLVPLVIGLLLAVPGLDILGGLVYGLGLIASALSAFLLFVWVPASWLVLPAVACDGADPFDATQRAYGTVLGRPLGVLAHIIVALVQGVVLCAFVWIIADLAVALASGLGSAFTTEAQSIVLGTAAGEGGTRGTASALVAVWNRVPVVLALSYAISYAHCASTAVYLNARTMVDGQEPSELWMPGDAAGVPTLSPGPAPSVADPGPADADPGSSEPRG